MNTLLLRWVEVISTMGNLTRKFLRGILNIENNRILRKNSMRGFQKSAKSVTLSLVQPGMLKLISAWRNVIGWMFTRKITNQSRAVTWVIWGKEPIVAYYATRVESWRLRTSIMWEIWINYCIWNTSHAVLSMEKHEINACYYILMIF